MEQVPSESSAKIMKKNNSNGFHTKENQIRVEKKLGRLAARGVIDFDMIEEGDRILAAVSGGKDSFVMIRLLKRMQRIAPVPFEIVAFHLHHGLSRHSVEDVAERVGSIGVEFQYKERDLTGIIRDKLRTGTTVCSLCSRLRRGILYTESTRLGCNKIALGHHREDLIHTFLLNILFTGQLKTMAPKLFSDDGDHIVIRPMAYCPQGLIDKYADLNGIVAVEGIECGFEDQRRNEVRQLVVQLSKRYPKVNDSIFASMKHIRSSHLLDPTLALRACGQAE